MKYYKWRANRSLSADAQKVGEELDALLSIDGTFTPRRVVDAARDPSSAMHSCFEWDNEKCGELYRIEQARYLVRSVVTFDPNAGKSVVPEPIVVHTKTAEGKPVYAAPRLLREDADMLQSAVAVARAGVEQAQARVQEVRRIQDSDARREAAQLLEAASAKLNG